MLDYKRHMDVCIIFYYFDVIMVIIIFIIVMTNIFYFSVYIKSDFSIYKTRTELQDYPKSPSRLKALISRLPNAV